MVNTVAVTDEESGQEIPVGFFYDNTLEWINQTLATFRAVMAEQGLDSQVHLTGIVSLIDLMRQFMEDWNRRATPAYAPPWEVRHEQVTGDHIAKVLITSQELTESAMRLRDSGTRDEEIARAPLQLEELAALADELARGSASFLLRGEVTNTSELVQVVNSFRKNLSDEVARVNLEATRESAEEVLGSIKEAAGEAGSFSLAQHFEENARREKVTADRLRLGVVICTAAVIVTAAYWTFFVEAVSSNPLRDLVKLSISIPVAVLAVYLGRESSRHRAAADWSLDITLQLKTLEAYISPLEPQQRTEIRAALGARVFGGGRPPHSSGDEAGVPSVSELGDLVAKIGEAVKPSAKP